MYRNSHRAEPTQAQSHEVTRKLYAATAALDAAVKLLERFAETATIGSGSIRAIENAEDLPPSLRWRWGDGN